MNCQQKSPVYNNFQMWLQELSIYNRLGLKEKIPLRETLLIPELL